MLWIDRNAATEAQDRRQRLEDQRRVEPGQAGAAGLSLT
jgi:hypothetical protein